MKLILSVPVTHAIGDGLLREILTQGWDGVRVDLNEAHPEATAQLREFVKVPECYPVILLAHGTMKRLSGEAWGRGAMLAHVHDTCVKMDDLGLFDRDEPPAIEIGNEPDLAVKPWRDYPTALGGTFAEAYNLVRGFSRNAPVLTPSVSNLNERGIRYLEKMYQRGIPDGAHCAFHRYPDRGNPTKAHDGFVSREAELARLRGIVGLARPLWLTETGFANYEYRGQFTSAERQAEIFEGEHAFWAGQGVKAMTWYQINDSQVTSQMSDEGKRMATYGIRDHMGNWKPVVERVRRLKGVQT